MDKILKIENNEANQRSLFEQGYVWAGFPFKLQTTVKGLNNPFLYINTKTKYITYNISINQKEDFPTSNFQEVLNIEKEKDNLIQLLNSKINEMFASLDCTRPKVVLVTHAFKNMLLDKKAVRFDEYGRSYLYQDLIVKRCLDMGDNMFEIY